MFAAKHISGRDALALVDKYASRSPTRKDAIRLASQETGCSVGAIRTAACREGKRRPRDSVRKAFSKKEEMLLEMICVIYARQGMPLSYNDFIELASIFAKKDKKHPFSRKFVSGFLRRHDKVLQNSYGKITSPIRCRDTTQEKTKEFISLINRYRRKNTLNKRNTFVFDETIIGDSCRIPLVIGERRKCGGGNINVIRIREKALGCYIPFSMPDGSTPFRVFILRSGSKKECRIHPLFLQPIAERKLRTQPHRLFLQSEKGFLTIGLFKIIMEDFIKWWNRDHKGLHFLFDIRQFEHSPKLHYHRDYIEAGSPYVQYYARNFPLVPGT